jgi:alanyl-tRNA synthetase
VPLGEIGKGMFEFIEKTTQIENRLKFLVEKAVKEKAQDLINKAANASANSADAKADDTALPVIVVESYAEESIDEVLNIGKIAQKKSQAVFILTSEQTCKFAAFCSTKDFDMRAFIKNAFEAQGGKGGGSSSFFQGSFGTKEALAGFLQEISKGRGNDDFHH